MVALAEARRSTSSAFMVGETPDKATLRAVAAGVARSVAPQVVARQVAPTAADAALAAGAKAYHPPVLEDIVSRLRVSYPILRAAKVDNVLRQLMLVMLIELNQ
jgi:hypothetical protein